MAAHAATPPHEARVAASKLWEMFGERVEIGSDNVTDGKGTPGRSSSHHRGRGTWSKSAYSDKQGRYAGYAGTTGHHTHAGGQRNSSSSPGARSRHVNPDEWARGETRGTYQQGNTDIPFDWDPEVERQEWAQRQKAHQATWEQGKAQRDQERTERAEQSRRHDQARQKEAEVRAQRAQWASAHAHEQYMGGSGYYSAPAQQTYVHTTTVPDPRLRTQWGQVGCGMVVFLFGTGFILVTLLGVGAGWW